MVLYERHKLGESQTCVPVTLELTIYVHRQQTFPFGHTISF